jgi:uncharacterized phage protein gp47/JayE
VTTLAPQISATGISAPSYADILAELQNAYYSIYGSDAIITPDTQDGQFLAIVAQAIYDTGQACIATYNAFAPSTAQGTGLSSMVSINGLTRKAASNSTVTLTITGVAGTVITNGMVGDNQNLNTVWALPSSVTIGSGGTVSATATSTTLGNVSAAAGTLVNILTPTLGWQSVTNPSAATVGQPQESDAALRIRQASSAGLPNLTPLEGIYAAIAAVAGVGQLAIFENDTDSTNALTIPPHCISCVVQGGTIAAVAAAIAAKKSPGTSTYGTTSKTVIDQNGVPDLINFYQLAEIPIYVQVTLTPLTGFVSTTTALIQQAIAAWISQLGIGGNVYLNKLFAPANLSGDVAVAATGYGQAQLDAFAATYNVTGIEIGLSSGSLGTSDLTIAFYQAAISAVADINVIT